MQHLGGVASRPENYQCPELGYACLKVTFPRAPITLASFAEKTHDVSMREVLVVVQAQLTSRYS